MPHDGSGDGWNETLPQDSDPYAYGAQEIRDLRAGVRIRMECEHENLATSGVGGEHLAGSAKIYSAVTASAPTVRPDGTTSLGANDEGRLWYDETLKTLFIYTGSAWSAVLPTIGTGVITGGMLADDTVTGSKMAHGTIVAENLASDSVETAKIKDANVTAAKLASDSVETEKVKDGAITAAKLATGATQLAAIGTYIGNGSTVNKITLTFQPVFVQVWKESNGMQYHGNSKASATTMYKDSSGDPLTSAITYNEDGFTITSTSQNVNQNSFTYHYIALKE